MRALSSKPIAVRESTAWRPLQLRTDSFRVSEWRARPLLAHSLPGIIVPSARVSLYFLLKAEIHLLVHTQSFSSVPNKTWTAKRLVNSFYPLFYFCGASKRCLVAFWSRRCFEPVSHFACEIENYGADRRTEPNRATPPLLQWSRRPFSKACQ